MLIIHWLLSFAGKKLNSNDMILISYEILLSSVTSIKFCFVVDKLLHHSAAETESAGDGMFWQLYGEVAL